MNPIEHLLTCLGEEGSEISQDCCKSTRFGLDDVNLLHPEGPTNRQRIVDEINDLMGVIDLCIENGILPKDWMDPFKIEQKKKKVLHFMKYAESKGSLVGKSSSTGSSRIKDQILRIRDVVCDQHCISVSDIMRKVKTEHVVIPRWIAFRVAVMIAGSTMLYVAAIFKVNHGTVAHGIKKLQDRMDTDPKFKAHVENVEKMCRESLAANGL